MKKIDPRIYFLNKIEQTKQEKLSSTVSYLNMVQDNQELVPWIKVLIKTKDDQYVPKLDGLKIRAKLDNIITAEINPDVIDDLEKDPGIIYVERASTLHKLTTIEKPSLKINIPRTPKIKEDGTGVIVGVIDSGLDFTHKDFLTGGKSRILYYWDQAAQPKEGFKSPANYNYGLEYTQDMLTEALAKDDPFSYLGTEEVEVSAHGTHVLGIACGNGSEDPKFKFKGVAPKADIIFVQPNTDDYAITGGFGDSVHLAEAIKYVFDKGVELNKPVVINLSMGTNYGPHDGTTLVEQWIDKCLGVNGRAVVLALGNEHNQRFNRTHSEGKINSGEEETLYWRMLPNDKSPNEMEIWYSCNDRFKVEILLPDGTKLGEYLPNTSKVEKLNGGNTIVYVSNELYSPLNGDNRINIIVMESENDDSPLPEGYWQIKVTSIYSIEGEFDAWIERDGWDGRTVLQSSFAGGSYIRRKTLGSIQSSRFAITVSNYDDFTMSLADSTSYGPTRDGRKAPIVAAPGTNILSVNSNYKKASASEDKNPYTSMTGTSMSAPYVTGVLACLLQKNRLLTSSQIKGILSSSANPAPGVDFGYRNDWGFGRVDLEKAIEFTPEKTN